MSGKRGRGPKSNRQRLTDLLMNGDVGGLRALLAAGADPNEPDESGYPPLALAYRSAELT